MKIRSMLCALAIGATALSACHKQAATANNNKVADTNVNTGSAAKSSLADGLANDHRFAAAIHQAGLDRTLSGQGPYTVLVPNDAAFARIPQGTMDGMMKPEGRQQLTAILTYHILPGVMLIADIDRAITNGKGSTKIATMNGSTLTATKDGGTIVLTDPKGDKSRLVSGDEEHGNGVIQHVDTVLMPS